METTLNKLNANEGRIWLAQGLRCALAFLMASVLVFAGSLAIEREAHAQSARKLTKVTWAIDSFLTSLPQRVAKERGYFEEEGVDIEFRVSSMGIDTMDAIIAGGADLGVGAHYGLMMRMTKPNIGIGGFILAWRVPVCLMASPNIKTTADLRGKNIAVISGSVWDWFTQKALDKGGVTRDKVELKSFGSPIDYLAAALRGDVDAAWFWEANLVRAEQALKPKGWTCLAQATDLAPQAAIDGWGPLPMSIKAAQEKPEALAGALRAYKRAADWCVTNVDECAKIANKTMGIPADVTKTLLPQHGYYVGVVKSSIDVMKEMKSFALERGFMARNLDYDFDSKVLLRPAQLAFPDGGGTKMPNQATPK